MDTVSSPPRHRHRPLQKHPVRPHSIIRSAKSRRIPFATDTIFKSPSNFVDSGDDFASSPCVFVTQNGDSKSELLGLVSRSYWGAVGERGGWGGGGCVQCERCGEDSGVSEAGAAVVGGRWGFHGGRGDGDEVRLGLLKASLLGSRFMAYR
ncbi:hypothetical protein Syun_023947 [Stephania yunnanensis]|uniref:Uncharacterized protein n=1 Tax=Stephania yunnanensis TaxID=152371 RepID=A0AAP0FAR4_9MAGN